MNRPKQKKVTRKELLKTIKSLESYRELYTKAVYSIMEIRHALGDTDAKWSHPELIENIKKLVGKEDSPVSKDDRPNG